MTQQEDMPQPWCDSDLMKDIGKLSLLEWVFAKDQEPDPGRVVLGCMRESRWASDTEPSFSFELLRRCKVGSLCGNTHPNADNVSWYKANFSACYHARPYNLVCWAYIVAPTAAKEAQP